MKFISSILVIALAICSFVESVPTPKAQKPADPSIGGNCISLGPRGCVDRCKTMYSGATLCYPGTEARVVNTPEIREWIKLQITIIQGYIEVLTTSTIKKKLIINKKLKNQKQNDRKIKTLTEKGNLLDEKAIAEMKELNSNRSTLQAWLGEFK